MTENWRPVVGFEGSFSISDTAQVRSEAREVPWNGTVRRVRTKILSQHKDSQGYLRITLGQDSKLYSKLMHVLLLEAFISPRPEGRIGCHWDDNKLNNSLSNLYWGTHKENGTDCVRNGNHPLSQRMHCKNRHEYTPENTGYERNGRKRRCRKCAVISSTKSQHKAKQKATK